MVADGTYAFLEGFDEARIPWRRAVSAFGVLMESVARDKASQDPSPAQYTKTLDELEDMAGGSE